MPEDKKPLCPRCELEKQAAEMTPERIASIVAELHDDAGSVASGDVYKARLEACASCDALRNGMLCSWCGCYVALRARPAAGYCPYPGNSRW